MKRFYNDVAVAADNSILLDGKSVKTPARHALIVPNRALAEAIAAEWREQGDTIDPAAMKLTKLANTAIDRVAHMRGEVIDQILAFGHSDLLCYRADFPDDLTRRQEQHWQPLLDWAAGRFALTLNVGQGIGHIAQRPEAFTGVQAYLESQSDFTLAGTHTVIGILGSLVLTLALLEGHITADTAFRLSQLDEDFQAEKWGRDAEAELRVRNYAADLTTADRFLSLARS
jgi:chaperone required for assembly of F1-ATPase